jgi:hypothetical protein
MRFRFTEVTSVAEAGGFVDESRAIFCSEWYCMDWNMQVEDDRAERALRIYGPSGLIRLSVAGAVTSHFPTRNT